MRIMIMLEWNVYCDVPSITQMKWSLYHDAPSITTMKWSLYHDVPSITKMKQKETELNKETYKIARR